jgi:translation initiation factor IF-2
MLQKALFQQGKMVTINDTLDEETALELALEIGVDLRIKRPRSIEDELSELIDQSEPEELLKPRPPIVTILGHVDHGKTTLLDRIRSSNVAAGEAGGITQHIAAYQVSHNGRKITFVDTPGHAAFGEMRARGANVTDIVVLVVAADDGVMPQTVECISHAKAAGVPILVALNKMDLPGVNEQRTLQGLAQHDVLPAEWGGDVEVIRTSAATGQGIEDLLENLLLTAELHNFRANPDRPALGVCLEAFRDEGRGVIAWLIVQRGTLRVGDVVLCGQAYGRVRAIYNDRDEEITEAPPSAPVRIAGLDIVPGPGDRFFVMPDLEEARQVAEDRRQAGRTELLAGRSRPRTLEDILDAARGGAPQDLPLVIKADTPGSLEALRGEIEKFQHPEVRVEIVHEGVGGVNESDVSLASASGAIVIAFHVIPEDRAAQLAEREGVDIRRYRIIYEVTDEIKRVLEGMLKPERVEVATGRALVLQTFNISRFGTIAGCRVLNGTIERSNRIHVIRDQAVLNDYPIASLRREKDDVREVREGMECGIRLEGFNDVKEGDLLEAYRIDEIKRTLD